MRTSFAQQVSPDINFAEGRKNSFKSGFSSALETRFEAAAFGFTVRPDISGNYVALSQFVHPNAGDSKLFSCCGCAVVVLFERSRSEPRIQFFYRFFSLRKIFAIECEDTIFFFHSAPS